MSGSDDSQLVKQHGPMAELESNARETERERDRQTDRQIKRNRQTDRQVSILLTKVQHSERQG